MTGLPADIAQTLMAEAQKTAARAYAPYSAFLVGAALLTESGEIITGVNVENLSYGLTLCAERAAVVRAVAMGQRQFKAVAVWASERPYGAVTPCGACRQVLAEFMSPDGVVLYMNEQTGSLQQTSLGALLPEGFSARLGPRIDSNKPNEPGPVG